MNCEKCNGKCCTSILPTSFEERQKIINYIKDNGIEGYNYNSDQNIFNTEYHDTCPFLNPRNYKCMIYEVRPEICRKYDCNNEIGKSKVEHSGKKIVNFYEEFCPDIHILYKPDVKELDKKYQEKKRGAGIK